MLFGYLVPKVNFLYSDRDFSQWSYTRGYNFPIGTTPKRISVSELKVIFWGSPLFLAVLGIPQFIGVPTLNFGPILTKFRGTVRAIKKMTQKDNGRPERW